MTPDVGVVDDGTLDRGALGMFDDWDEGANDIGTLGGSICDERVEIGTIGAAKKNEGYVTQLFDNQC